MKRILWLGRREAYAIKGPRQSGKTTLLRALEGNLKREGVNVVFLNFEDPDVLEAFETVPKGYVKSFLLKEGRYCFLMDEYHYVKDPGMPVSPIYARIPGDGLSWIVSFSTALYSSSVASSILSYSFFSFPL